MLFNFKELYGLLGLKKVPLKKRESCMITGFSLFMMPEQSGKLIPFFDLQMVFFAMLPFLYSNLVIGVLWEYVALSLTSGRMRYAPTGNECTNFLMNDFSFTR